MPLLLWMLVAALAAVMLGFSQTVAFYGDEGVHLLAARLVNAGKRPYLDFFYPHTPLWIYISAAWMRIFGDTWRSVHVLSALLSGAGTAMVAHYVFSRAWEAHWRVATAAAAALLTGLSYVVIWYGTIAQAYGLSLFLNFAAFRLVVGAVAHSWRPQAFLAGVCAGTSVGSLLLSAPAPVILLLWLARHTDPGHRIKVGAYFLAGTLPPLVPLGWLALQEPRQVWFNILEYHLFYRATWFDPWAILRLSLSTLTAWLSSVQALLLILLAAIAVTVLVSSREWDEQRRRELRLCAWLAGGLALFLATPLPTFPQYFVLAVPFLSVLASVGIHRLGARLWPSTRPFHVLLPIVLLFVLGLGKPAYHLRLNTWHIIEDLGREVARVTPENGFIYAFDLVVFAAKRVPPPGMENVFGSMLRLPSERLAALHIVPQSQIERWLEDGRFHTVMMFAGDPKIQTFGLLQRYSYQQKLHGVFILSDPVR